MSTQIEEEQTQNNQTDDANENNVKKDRLFKSLITPVTDEDEKLIEKSEWMIRHCENYNVEHRMCIRPRGRFYQLYIDGEFKDCKPYLELRKFCKLWIKENHIIAGSNIIRYEKKRREDRIQSRLNNDTWTLREERPPPNWNCPLPKHISDKYPDSYLMKETEKYREEGNLPPIIGVSTFCTIM